MKTHFNDRNGQQKNYWLIIVLLFIVSFIAGIIGFRRYFVINEIDHDLWRSLYCTLQLYVLKSGDVEGFVPVGLQLARFIAPLASALAIILTLFEIFREQWNNWMISRMKNHVVIIGFGSKGKNIMDEYLEKGKWVLIIEQDPANPNLGFTHARRCRLMIGDGTNASTLSKANITKADFCYLLLGEDSMQVKACLEIYKMIIESGRDRAKPLNCVMHLNKQEFLSTMKENELVRDQTDAFNLTIFNVYENSSRHLFMKYPPDREGLPADSGFFVQMIIFGFGLAGEALALQTALTGQYANKKKSHVVIFDRSAKVKVPDFLERYPTFTEYCDLEYDNMEADSPQLVSHLVKYLRRPLALTSVVFCFDSESQNLLLGLQLKNMNLEDLIKPIHVFVRTKNTAHFTTLPQSINPYGLPSQVCNGDVIFGELLDKKARAIQQIYYQRRQSEADFGSGNADVPWEQLGIEFRESNRKVADHIGVKVRAIGCDVVCIEDPGECTVFTKEEIELLAELEHRRWCAERSLAGWTKGPIRDKVARITPFLIDWNDPELDESVKDYDRDSVISIPSILKLAGEKAIRRNLKS